MTFAQSIELPRIIATGIGDEMSRQVLFEQLNRSPDSSSSRQLVTSSSRYGLTVGGYQAESLQLTSDGKRIANGDPESDDIRRLMFKSAIEKVDCFKSLHEQLQGKPIPAAPILHDALRKLNVAKDDCEKAATVFLGNLRFLGLLKESDEGEKIFSLEEVLGEGAASNAVTPEEPNSISLTEATQIPNAEEVASPPQPNLPALHIDVQIHIDSSASPEQIDQVFASMARHLYGRDT